MNTLFYEYIILWIYFLRRKKTLIFLLKNPLETSQDLKFYRKYFLDNAMQLIFLNEKHSPENLKKKCTGCRIF